MAVIKTVKIEVDGSDAIKEIDNINDSLQETDDKVTDIKESSEGIGGGFDNAAKGAGKFKTAIQGVGTALKAAGIGLALAAIAKITDIFRNSPAGAKIITTALETVNQAMYALWNNAGNVAAIFKAIFDGQFGVAAGLATVAWNEIAESVGGAYEAGKKYAELEEELRVLRNDNLVLLERERQAIADNQAIAENTDNALRTRLEAYKEIENASLRLVQVRQNEARKELELIKSSASANTIASQERTAQLKAEIIAAETERTTILKDATNQRNALLASSQEQEIEIYRASLQKKLDVDDEFRAIEISKTHQTEAEKTRLENEAAEARITIAEQEAAAKEAAIDATGQALTNLSVIAGKETVAGKALAIAASLINVYQGITKAIALGGFAGIAQGVAVAAAGFAAVKNIIDTPIPGESGSGGGSAPSAPTAAPQFNIVQASPENALLEQINENTARPAKAYVVSTEVTSQQALDRQIVQNASF